MKDVDKARFLDAPISQGSPSSSRRYSSRLRWSSTSCPGVMHHPPLPPGPGLSLPVAVGALLRPPELLRLRPNRHIGRCVEPLAGERRPPDNPGNPEMLEVALSQETARTATRHNSTRLRDSVRQATSQVQRRSRDVGGSPERPCLARGDCCPPGKRMQSSRSLQPRWGRGFTALTSSYPRKVVAFDQSWICESWTGLCTSSRSRCWRKGAWSNAFSPRIGLQYRPEGRLLSRFDPSATQTVSTVCVRRSGMAVQGPSLRALPVSPCVHEGCRGRPYPVTGSGRQDPQLPRRLAYSSPIQRAVGRSQGSHRDHSQLGLRVNWEKSKFSPVQRISFLGVELDSVSMTVRLTEERAQAVLNCLSSFRGRNVVTLKQFQRLLGHMASAAAVTPLGLLHMRPLQHWLHSRVPRWAWRRVTLRVGISQQCRRSLSPWTDRAFLRAGVPLEQVSRHTVVTTDASSTGCTGLGVRMAWFAFG